MWNKGPRMWAKMAEQGIQVPSLSEAEMSDLISYLYFFQFIDPPGDAKRGWAVYKEKQCGTCHAATGAGEPVAPSLAEVMEKLQSPLEVITEMWNHAGKMEEKMLEENVAWPILKGGEMADLIAYLLSVHTGAAPSPGASRIRSPKGAGGER
ncbi:MAG: c-type cytochrome, partial [Chloroflexota bacterium]